MRSRGETVARTAKVVVERALPRRGVPPVEGAAFACVLTVVAPAKGRARCAEMIGEKGLNQKAETPGRRQARTKRMELSVGPQRDDQKGRTEALEQQVLIYKTLASLSECVYTFDRQGRFLYANQSLLALLGVDLAGIVGRTFFELPYSPELAKQLHSDVERAFATRAKVVGETPYTNYSGQRGFYEYIFTPVFSEDGSVEILAGSSRDITIRKEAQAALLRSEKLAAGARLAATLAHEINNPLQAVMNTMTILRHSPRLGAEDIAFVAIAEEALERVACLTQQSLSFYRESVCATTVNVEEMLDEALGLFAGKMQLKGIATTRRYAAGGRTIESFPAEIRQVFSTLLVKALEALPQLGTITLGVKPAYHRGLRVSGMRVAIADNGGASAEHTQARVYDRMFPMSGQAAMGAGLWVANGLVNRMGGALRMWSWTQADGSGTCFSVFLPWKIPERA